MTSTAQVSARPSPAPHRSRAGRIAARARWGPEPRIVRLDDLTPAQRRLVVALVDAARREATASLKEQP